MSLSLSLSEPDPVFFHCHCSRDHLSSTTTTMRLPLPSATNPDLGNSLPNEILGAIFDCLSPAALARAALVSRRWRANAERILYSTIIIHEVLPRASPTLATAVPAEPELKDVQMTTTMPAVPITTLRCCETLSSHPHLVQYVKRFHLRWETDAVESLSFGLAACFPDTSNNAPPQFPPSLANPPPSPSPSPPPHIQKQHGNGTEQQQQLQHQL